MGVTLSVSRTSQTLAVGLRVLLLLIVLWLCGSAQLEIKTLSSPSHCNSLAIAHIAEDTVSPLEWKHWQWLRPWPVVAAAILAYVVLRLPPRSRGRASHVASVFTAIGVGWLFVVFDAVGC
jgi:hypothetical protein